MHWADAKTFTAAKKALGNKTIHLKKASGDMKQNFAYCTKGPHFKWVRGQSTIDSKGHGEEAIVFGNIERGEDGKKKTRWEQEAVDLKQYYQQFELKKWQKELYDMLTVRCTDDRTVHWLWEGKGDQGKSWFAKYLYNLVPDVMIVTGKAGDIFNMLTNYKEVDIVPRIVVLDVPRSVNKEAISMPAIEKLKDGLMFAGKYKGGIHNLFSPHVVVFANVPPSEEQRAKLSADRWHVGEIKPDGTTSWESDGNKCLMCKRTDFNESWHRLDYCSVVCQVEYEGAQATPRREEVIVID